MMNVLLTKRENKWHDQKAQKLQREKQTYELNQSSVRSNIDQLGNIFLYYLATSIASLYFWGAPTIPFLNYYVSDVALSSFSLMGYYAACSMVALFCLAIIACKKLLTTQKTTVNIKLVSVAYFIAVIINVALMLDAKNMEVVSWLYELDDIAQTVIDLILVFVGVFCMGQLMRSR